MSDTPTPSQPRPFRRWLDRLPQWAGPLAALMLLVIYTVAHEFLRGGGLAFLRPENLINIVYQWSFVGIIAIGMTLAMTLGGIDLSVGSLVAFIGGLGIWVMNTVITAPGIIQSVRESAEIGITPDYGAFRAAMAHAFVSIGVGGSEAWGAAAGMAVMLVVGPLAGLLHGVLIAKGRISPLIVTLGGLAAYRSLAQSLVDGGEFRSSSPVIFGYLGQGGIPLFGGLRLPYPVIFFALAAVAAYVLLNRTRYGRYVTAIGCNERAAVYSAIPVGRIKMLTYTLVGLASAVSALLVSSRMNSVSSGQTGLFYELDAIAAVVVGGTRMRGGAGTIAGTVIGVLMLGVIGNMLNMLDAPVYLQGLVKGVVIVAAVLVQRRDGRES
ncbi:MAG: ABC transporter permease [Planctomycetes bacterium]|nr:ABC transporter permease [Planctomycetota bacterium]